MNSIYQVRAEVVNAVEASEDYNTLLEALGADCTYWHKHELYGLNREIVGVLISLTYKGYSVTIDTNTDAVAVAYGDGREEVSFYTNDSFNKKLRGEAYYYKVVRVGA